MRVHQHSAITAILQHSDNEHAAEEQNNDKNFRSMKKPIWKTVHHEQLDFTHQRNDKDKKTTETKLSKSDYLLPDVGILVHRASPRILQTNNVQEGYAADDNYLTGGIHSDYCKYFQSRNSTCDCNNWSTDGLGSFECLRYGQEYCVNNVCRTVTMNMEGSFLEPSSMSYMMELCTITTSSQEQHTYCASILTLNELASDGSILGSSYTCNLSVDGSDCKKCSIDTYCVLATNPWDIVPSLVGKSVTLFSRKCVYLLCIVNVLADEQVNSTVPTLPPTPKVAFAMETSPFRTCQTRRLLLQTRIAVAVPILVQPSL